MKKFINILLITTLALFLSGVAYGNEVIISSPSNGEKAGARVIVKGTSKLNDESHIWILVHAKLLQDQWWPQSRPVVDENGNWQALSYIGQSQDIGLEFEIAAASFDKDAEAKILKYHDVGKKTGQWLPIPFPRTTSPIKMVTVKKTSH